MSNHISIGTSALSKARAFYDSALSALGYRCLSEDAGSLGYGDKSVAFWVLKTDKPVPDHAASGLHICFSAPTRESVDRFHTGSSRPWHQADVKGADKMAIETVELLWSKPTCARRLHFTRQFSATICAVVALTAAPAADAKFGEPHSDGGGNTMVRFLAAHGPNDDLGKGAATFARFEGDWTVDCIYIDEKGNKQPTAGEWHFGWILAGRAFQDVIYFYPAGERPKDPSQLRGGTTVRVYDPKRGQWTITWNNAAKGWAILLRGGAVDDRIILTGSDIDGSALRWTFHDISPRRFLWRGEVSKDGGVTWRIEQTMVVTREGAALRPRY